MSLGCFLSRNVSIGIRHWEKEKKGSQDLSGEVDNNIGGYTLVDSAPTLGTYFQVMSWDVTRANGPGDSDGWLFLNLFWEQYLPSPLALIHTGVPLGAEVDLYHWNLEPSAVPTDPVEKGVNIDWWDLFLGDEEYIKVQKPQLFSWLGIYAGVAPDGSSIPSECREVWIFYILPRSNLPSDFDPTEYAPTRMQRVKRICSEPLHPPPEVRLICGPIDCPPNTCKVRCENGWCCYNKHGISVKSIVETLGDE